MTSHKKTALSKAVQKPVPVKIVGDSPSSPSTDKAYDEREKKWRAEDDIRTLQRAEEIKRDKARMSYAKKCAAEQIKALKNVK